MICHGFLQQQQKNLSYLAPCSFSAVFVFSKENKLIFEVFQQLCVRCTVQRQRQYTLKRLKNSNTFSIYGVFKFLLG